MFNPYSMFSKWILKKCLYKLFKLGQALCFEFDIQVVAKLLCIHEKFMKIRHPNHHQPFQIPYLIIYLIGSLL